MKYEAVVISSEWQRLYLIFFRLFLASAPESDRSDLLSELEVMKTLKPHPHVIRLLGCVTETGKTYD